MTQVFKINNNLFIFGYIIIMIKYEIKYNKQYKKLLKKINDNLKQVFKIANIESFLKLSKSEQDDTIRRARLFMNDVSSNLQKFFDNGKHDVLPFYQDEYNKSAKSLRKLGIPIQNLDIKTVPEIKDINNQLARALSDSIETANRLMDMRFEMSQQFKKAIEAVNPAAFTPRATLLNFTNRFQDKDGKRVLMKEFRQTQRDVVDYLRNEVIPNGLSIGEAAPKLRGMMNKHFPTGKVAFPVRRDGKTYNRHIDIGDYAEGWFHDNHARAHSEGVLGAASTSGADIVDIYGGITDNPICDPFVETKTFSLTGKTKGYPILRQYPPFHPYCSKRMRISLKNK
jgi:hypothetical protein